MKKAGGNWVSVKTWQCLSCSPWWAAGTWTWSADGREGRWQTTWGRLLWLQPQPRSSRLHQALVTKTQYSFGYSQRVLKGAPRRAWAHPIFGTTKTRAISTNAQSRFASIVCLATSASSTAHLIVSLNLCSSGSNVRGELRALFLKCWWLIRMKRPNRTNSP